MSPVDHTAALVLGSPPKDIAGQPSSAPPVIIYIDDASGSDDASTPGTKESPFQSLFAAYIAFPPESSTPSPVYFARVAKANGQEDAVEWREAAKSAMKKVVSRYAEYVKKMAKQNEEEADRQATLVEARRVVIQEDHSLPKAIRLKISAKAPEGVTLGSESATGTRVKVIGRIDNIRVSKTRTFVYLTDTRDTLLCLFEGAVNAFAPVLFQKQTSIEVFGQLKSVPAKNKAPGDRELHADYYRIIGEAPGGPESFTNIAPTSAHQSTLPDARHLVLRRREEAMVMKARSSALSAFRQYYNEHEMREATAPSFVQTQVEGGGSLFSLSYYGERAYLTQTSQLYLEAQLPVLGDCYAIQSSFRAENSHTRRHLSEYTHIEGELDFIEFDDLLNHIEDLLCGVIKILLAHPESRGLIMALNPDFKSPARPFRRMRYAEAIEWLNAHGVMDENGVPHVFGTDIAEAAERRMTDEIGVPIMLTHFPVPIKAFYMKRDAGDPRVTESVDCLVPGVGEVVGAGMRMDDYDQLVEVMKENAWDLKAYAFYSDQRKYGTSPHGGYGMGIERFLAWILNRHSVRECVPFPRYPGKW
ncbi:asparaginyl-tRNA synthetase [Cordyceps militaris]|uniref:asparagine--tRNA ligase n=1 Tax=Cordyceps militaris TaxID=73501 RepID=A0A2H4SHK7_CORMI|nr:asparaginyl-tRNA synthetase [Cordyceps militaris]